MYLSDLDESDVPEIQEHHLEGIPHDNALFVIYHTRLCMIFSKAMKKIVSIKTPPEDRDEVIRQADEDLANFITGLPACLKLPISDPGTWQSILHLSYNNFLILLHRPAPREEHYRYEASKAGDHSICSDAAMAISSIFESLRLRQKLRHLWLPSLYVLFTAMVYAAKYLCSANPVVVAKSRQMFDSLLMTLRELSQHWLYAQSLLRLFEHRKLWQRDEQGDLAQQDVSIRNFTPGSLHLSSTDSSGQTPLDHTRRDPTDGRHSASSRSEEFFPLDGWLYPTSDPGNNEFNGMGDSWDLSIAPSDLEMFLASIGNDALFNAQDE